MEILVKASVNPKEWNERLKVSEYGNVYQTTFYADYTKRRLFKTPLFIVARENQNVLAQLLVFRSSKLHRYKDFITTFPGKILEKFQPRYDWHFGPVIFDKERKDEVYREFLSTIATVLGKRGRIIAIPHPLDDKLTFFSDAGFEAEERATFVVDLGQDVEELWRGMDKKSGRKNVERARKRGVRVEVIEREDEFKEYFRILVETRERSRVKVYEYQDSFALWDILGSNDAMKGFVAKKNGRVVAGILISTFNGYLNEWGAAHSSYSIENRLYANDLLRWHIIEWGHDEGYRCYDLTGVALKPKDVKEQGIYRFKKKWGGELVTYHKYTL